jgi:hypothetical protein
MLVLVIPAMSQSPQRNLVPLLLYPPAAVGG